MIYNFRSHIEVMKDHRLMSSNIKENIYVSEQVSYLKGRTQVQTSDVVFWHGTSGDDEGFHSLPITDASKHSSRSRRILMDVFSASLKTFPNFHYCWSWLSASLLGIQCGARAAVGIENHRSSQNSPDWKIFTCGFQAQALPQLRGEELLCASPLPGSLEAHKWSVGLAGLVCPPDCSHEEKIFAPLVGYIILC